jgi:hypothetical protein
LFFKHGEHRAHRGKILCALCVLCGLKLKNYNPYAAQIMVKISYPNKKYFINTEGTEHKEEKFSVHSVSLWFKIKKTTIQMLLK